MTLYELRAEYMELLALLESDLYGGDKLRVLEMIFGIVREKKEGDE